MQYILLHFSSFYGFGELNFTYMSVSRRRARPLIVPGLVTYAKLRRRHHVSPELPLIVSILATG